MFMCGVFNWHYTNGDAELDGTKRECFEWEHAMHHRRIAGEVLRNAT